MKVICVKNSSCGRIKVFKSSIYTVDRIFKGANGYQWYQLFEMGHYSFPYTAFKTIKEFKSEKFQNKQLCSEGK